MPKEKKAAAPAPKYYPGDDVPAKNAKQTNGVSRPARAADRFQGVATCLLSDGSAGSGYLRLQI